MRTYIAPIVNPWKPEIRELSNLKFSIKCYQQMDGFAEEGKQDKTDKSSDDGNILICFLLI